MSWGSFFVMLSPVMQGHNQDPAMMCEKNQIMGLLGSAGRAACQLSLKVCMKNSCSRYVKINGF